MPWFYGRTVSKKFTVALKLGSQAHFNALKVILILKGGAFIALLN
jgi:hypothetical protein